MQSPNELRDIISGWIDGSISNIHTAMPGKIINYDASICQASVQPVGKFKIQDGRNLPFPIVHHVPVIFPSGLGGTAGVTVPLRSGDGCLLVFSESQLDDFLNGGDSDNERCHSLNDAICIPGLYNRGCRSASPSDVCLFNGGVKMVISAGGITVTGGDLVVEGISVTKHTHTGDSGGTTSAPK